MISKISNTLIALTIGLTMMMTITGTSWAHKIEPADSQIETADNRIDEAKARNIARKYLSSIGFNRPGTSVYSASVGKATLREDIWIVRVATGTGTRLPYKKGVVLINAVNGHVKLDAKK